MSTLSTTVDALFAGGTGLLEPEGQPSGIFKRPVTGRIDVTPLGMAGDVQCDRRVHGGPEKAVHQYAVAGYTRLAARFPACAPALVAGSIGENLSAADMDETNVHVGDVFRAGSALLQVSQPRSPCWKIDCRFGAEGMSVFIAQARITGWYYRVLRPGAVEAGDALVLLDRPGGSVSIDRFWAIQSMHRPDLADLRALAGAPGLATAWRTRLEQRVAWLTERA